MRNKRLLSMALSMTMVAGLCLNPGLGLEKVRTVMQGEEVLAAEGLNQYGLADNIQDGVVLHCFDWKYNDIKNELPNIAKAGFTSVQTSPAQVGVNSGIWYWLYQPLGFYIGTNDLGTREELRQLCSEADKYGIKVIVDVVANHLAGNHTNIQDDLKDAKYWHNYGEIKNYSDRTAVTTGNLGMQDIKSEDTYVQSLVRNYILDLKSVGVDGIRWDAAKHIALPSEGCGFWSTVCNNSGLYHYGEILGEPGASSTNENNNLMTEYTSYMSCTDSYYGQHLRDMFNQGKAPTNYGNWTTRGIGAKKLVYWAESHDTWSNDKESGYSNEMSQNVIDRAYAMAASRQSATALYFSRPSSAVKTQIYAGVKGSTHFKSAEVAAVNHFHNAMIGQKEYFVSSNNVAAVCREKGVVIAMGSGSGNISIPNGGSTVAPGTYKDEITGNTFTITSSTISGTVGSTGIAVVYDYEKEVPTTTTSQTQYNAYIDLPSGWSTPVYCYVYDKNNGTQNASWPGVQLTYDSKTGYYKYTIPENITEPRVIFYSSSTNRYPGDQAEGLAMSSTNMVYKNSQWVAFNPNEVTTTQQPTTQPTTTQPKTTAQPTTIKQTTTQQITDGPIEVLGQLVRSDKDNQITLVWGQNEAQIANGQKYNVYLDGRKIFENVICSEYIINDVVAGSHKIKITATLNGKETSGVELDVDVLGQTVITQAPTTQQPTTQTQTTAETTTVSETTVENTTAEETTVATAVSIKGWQISTVNEGFRITYSITNPEQVVELGLIYSIADRVTEDKIYYGSTADSVYKFAATEKGRITEYANNVSAGEETYAMTMKFIESPQFYNARMAVRAYAKMTDGRLIYSDVSYNSVYDVTDYLYSNLCMDTEAQYNYLYDKILSVARTDYVRRENY